MKIKPLKDRLLVKIFDKEETVGRIHIPEGSRERPAKGIVTELGTGNPPFEIAIGDTVLLSKYGGTGIKLNGEDYRIFKYDEVLAIV